MDKKCTPQELNKHSSRHGSNGRCALHVPSWQVVGASQLLLHTVLQALSRGSSIQQLCNVCPGAFS